MKIPLRNLLLMLLMFAASGMAVALRPSVRISEQGPKFELQTLIPKQFGEWREELVSSAPIVDPQTKEMLDKIYSQLLSRTYVNAQGYRVMLSIAYGSDQTDTAQVHRPELCYPAQGFILHERNPDKLQLGSGGIPVTRLHTSHGLRQEPVTYWIMIGETVIQSGTFEKKMTELAYGLRGKIPDGILIRVSSIDGDKARAYEMHDRFSRQMVEALPSEMRWRLAGKADNK